MLSRKTFAEAIGTIKKHEELIDRLNEVAKELGDFPPNLDFESLNRRALISVLKESMNDMYDYISWWLYEATDDYTVSWEEDGRHEERNLKDVDALYDFLIEQTRTTGFEDIPIYDDPARDRAVDGDIPYKVINKNDFLTYFDRTLEYIEANDVALEIRGEGKDRYILLSIRLYNKMLTEEDALKKQLDNKEGQRGTRACNDNR